MKRSNVRTARLIFEVACIAIILGACAGGSNPTPPPNPPATFLESVEAANVVNDELGKKIAALTCQTFVAGKCSEPGFRLDPDEAQRDLETSNTLRSMLRQAANIAPGLNGWCGAIQTTREGCLTEIQKSLDNLQVLLTPK